eukprot:126494-Prymnesium_polylepis.1
MPLVAHVRCGRLRFFVAELTIPHEDLAHPCRHSNAGGLAWAEWERHGPKSPSMSKKRTAVEPAIVIRRADEFR